MKMPNIHTGRLKIFYKNGLLLNSISYRSLKERSALMHKFSIKGFYFEVEYYWPKEIKEKETAEETAERLFW